MLDGAGIVIVMFLVLIAIFVGWVIDLFRDTRPQWVKDLDESK